MAQKLKSQDLMEVFISKLDEVNLKFDLNKEIISTLDKKLEQIKNSSLKVEYEPLGKVVLENDKVFKDHRSELVKIFEKQISTMKNVSKKESKYQSYFYGALTVIFVLCTAFLSYGIEQYHEKIDAKKEMKFYSKEAFRRNEYLKEKNLTEKYEIWLVEKQKQKDQNSNK